MSDQFGMISRRRAFSLLGFSALVPAVIFSAAEGEAQTAGMERRQERREGRHERRGERRTGRHERRETRRGGEPATTGTTGAK